MDAAASHWLSLLLPGAFWPGVAVLVWVPLLALALDAWRGEPPAAWHPVVWMGNALEWWGKRLAPRVPVVRDWACFWLAALVWCALAAIVMVAAWVLQHLALSLYGLLAAALLGMLLKPLMAWRMLKDEVVAVDEALARSLPEGRERLARLVSRDVTELDAAQVRESAIESLAENLNDSVVAPLFWFALLGLPGAALYRFANTADAMWGYLGERQGRDWTWAGKWAARADDVLSWLPARLTAALLSLLGTVGRLRQLPSQAGLTPSPNSGWPMAAMALALNVSLAKPGVYILHPAGRSPQAADTARALALATRVVVSLAALAVVACVCALVRWGGPL